ncbi:porin family protein [Bradyrhizobium sp. 200]|uniref:outer membrane protein n=1 Tax=Bradyrhizobium sp. 200 TaxID=2782665 RepID=UPI001FFFB293|nr:outer membrane protein [Bradyrhizobium sp. 200]UPJ53218.1 porin family protein [Bradyrhizobium sp. 200]
MKRLLLAGVALSVATAASAADMQARPYTKAPPAVVSPAYNWSGFYIGAMGGYGWDSGDASGGFGGGTVGYNWQFPGSQFVFGIEVDAAGASIKDSLTADLGGVLATEELKINSFGSVTGRAGFALDAALIYAKGGFAWANRKDSVSFPAFGVSISDSQSHTGYTIGGGLEYLFTPNWSAKGEYMYTSLGSETYNLDGFPPFDSGTVDFHTIKVGVNYHFR